jgi:hypothetical protein
MYIYAFIEIRPCYMSSIALDMFYKVRHASIQNSFDQLIINRAVLHLAKFWSRWRDRYGGELALSPRKNGRTQLIDDWMMRYVCS